MLIYTALPAIIAGVSVVMDVKETRIDNGWIVFSLCLGLVLQTYRYGIGAVFLFGAGAVLPAVLLGALFYFRMLGAGDIKLFCALGGVMGIGDIVRCIVFSFLIGAVLSAAVMIFFGIFCQRLHYFYEYIQECLHTGNWKSYYRKGMELENIHFSVPIFLSTVLYAGGVY